MSIIRYCQFYDRASGRALRIYHNHVNYILCYSLVCLSAVVLFCLAAVIFPMGFHVDEIGGQPYQLPGSHQVGISYILFILALWITVISELFAGKVCLPHF